MVRREGFSDALPSSFASLCLPLEKKCYPNLFLAHSRLRGVDAPGLLYISFPAPLASYPLSHLS